MVDVTFGLGPVLTELLKMGNLKLERKHVDAMADREGKITAEWSKPKAERDHDSIVHWQNEWDDAWNAFRNELLVARKP